MDKTPQQKRLAGVRRYGSRKMKVIAQRAARLEPAAALAVLATARKDAAWIARFTHYLVSRGLPVWFSRELAEASLESAGADRFNMTPEDWAAQEIDAIAI